MTTVRVALDVPLTRLFDYLAEDATAADVGYRVRVPFGSGSGIKVGVIVAVDVNTDAAGVCLKTVAEILRDIPPLPQQWFDLCDFCARYYHHPPGQVMHHALPPMLRRGARPKHPAKPCPPAGPALPPPVPNSDQAAAIAAIGAGAGSFGAYLLHGVTGSGKTEVYLQAIAAVLADGGQALMLVPEIALTPQLQDRVKSRFPAATVVALHSGIADAARAAGFLAGLEGRADIVLGTRLSVFQPLPRLRLIIVDEEHDASYKQQEGLRYSARDLSVVRAKQAGIPVVLGSATPSLESFHHAHRGRYRLLELTQRAVAESMPTISTIDTRRQKLQDGFSAELLSALELRLARGEQSLIFLNRRGYAPVLACPACGWISSCRRCAANMVVHLADRRLRCHHCGLESDIPRRCPDCGNQDIHPFGRGTQRLEAALRERFPEARILRVDRDSASTPAKWQALLAAIHANEVDVLIGTQMLAKGHDFPRLTLVGVVGADAALFAADFRAPERLFAQLLQVGGRSGRADLPGEVLIQTEYPQHDLYRALAHHDFTSYAQHLLEERRSAAFPPFSHQALLRAEAPDLQQALDFLTGAAALAGTQVGPVSCYDPVPMRLARLNNLERAQLLVESTDRGALQAFLGHWVPALADLKAARDLRWHLDVDPLEL
jgi:primosomal protein N' (replication factor Y)